MQRVRLWAVTPLSAWQSDEERRFRRWARELAAPCPGAEIAWLAPDAHRAFTGSSTQPRFCGFLSLPASAAADVEIEAPPRMTLTPFLLSTQLAFDRMGATPGQPAPGVKKTTFWKARPDLSAERWQGRYRDHAKLVPRVHATASKYRQNLVESAPEGLAFDAISELWWDRESDLLERFYASAQAQRLVAQDTQAFIDLPSAIQIVTHHELR